MLAFSAAIQPGDTVAVWGCGPVGQMTIKSAWMLGAGRVIAIDCVPERLRLAESMGPAAVINFKDQDVYETLQQMTKGRGPDSCIDAVGLEAHGSGSFDSVLDKAKAAVMLTTDRAHVFRQVIHCVRKGGTVSVPGVYVGFPDKVPVGAMVGKGLTIKTGQTHVQRYLKPLLERIEKQHKGVTALVAFFSEIVERSLSDRERKGCFLVNSALEVAPHDKMMSKVVSAHLDAIRGFLRRQLQLAQASGEAVIAADPSGSADHLLSVLLGMRVLARSRPERALLERTVGSALIAVGVPEKRLGVFRAGTKVIGRP